MPWSIWKKKDILQKKKRSRPFLLSSFQNTFQSRIFLDSAFIDSTLYRLSSVGTDFAFFRFVQLSTINYDHTNLNYPILRWKGLHLQFEVYPRGIQESPNSWLWDGSKPKNASNLHGRCCGHLRWREWNPSSVQAGHKHLGQDPISFVLVTWVCHLKTPFNQVVGERLATAGKRRRQKRVFYGQADRKACPPPLRSVFCALFLRGAFDLGLW